MVELYQDTLIDLLLPKKARALKLDVKKDSKVIHVLLKDISYVFYHSKYYRFYHLKYHRFIASVN